MKKRVYQIVVFIIYIILISVFTALSLQSGSQSGGFSDKVGDIIKAILHLKIKDPDKYSTIIRKLLGHFCGGMAIGLFSSLFIHSINKLNVYIALGINLTYSFIYFFFTEYVLQNIASNRCPSMKDVLIDYSGFLIPALIIGITYIIIRRERK